MNRAAAIEKPDAKIWQREPTAVEMVRVLERDILFGKLRPRERLIEDTLMQRFAAKRYVVRQALLDLERIGIVVRSPNRGAAVRDFTVEEVEEIAEVRETLHRRAVQRMRLPAGAALIKALQAAQRQHDTAVAARDPSAIDIANETFHALLFGACGNKLLANAIAHYAYLSRAMRLYPLVDPALLETLRKEHWAMIDALKKGNRRTLTALVAGHIQHSKRIYLQVRRSLPRLPA
jgi:DNA-binding GntR family transcriptional regulator